MAKRPETTQSESMLPATAGLASLSPREREVLRYASAGYLDKQISAALGVSLNTLRTYWSRIRTKMGHIPRSGLVAAHTEQSVKSLGAASIDWDWEMDLRKDTYRSLSGHLLGSSGEEMTIADVLSMLHPDDHDGVVWLIEAAKAGQLTAFHYTARFLTKTGPITGSAFVRVISDEFGPYLAVGRRVPSMDMRATSSPGVLGYWGYDFYTLKFWADDACCGVLGMDSAAKDLREEFLSRFPTEDQARLRAALTSRNPESIKDIAGLYEPLSSVESKQKIRFDIYREFGPEGIQRFLCAVTAAE